LFGINKPLCTARATRRTQAQHAEEQAISSWRARRPQGREIGPAENSDRVS